MQKIISWNVASVRARLPALLKLLAQEQPDHALLQEIKATDETFPFFELRAAGYIPLIAGQKSYNGVAILSRAPLRKELTALPGLADEEPPQARFIQAAAPDGLALISVYVPNGNPPEKDPQDTARLRYKLRWLDALQRHIRALIEQKRPFVLGGDFNVIARDGDVYDPEAFRAGALMLPEVRAAFSALTALPLQNALRLRHPEAGLYTFWDFQQGAWQRNWGILLDYFFLSPELKLLDSAVHRAVRGWEKTSDHAPIACSFAA